MDDSEQSLHLRIISTGTSRFFYTFIKTIDVTKLLPVLVLLLSSVLYSQEAYILTTAGDKITIDLGEHFYDTGKKIKYYSGNAIFPKTIKITEVKEVVDGASVYKVYTFNDEMHLYKIIATSSDKTLLVRFLEPAANSSSGGLGMEYYVVDMFNTVLVSGEVSTTLSKKKAEQEKQATIIILEHFGECTVVTENLGKGIIVQPDGTNEPFDNNLPLGFKIQKGILKCD